MFQVDLPCLGICQEWLGQHGVMGTPLVLSVAGPMRPYASKPANLPCDSPRIPFTAQSCPRCWPRRAFGQRQSFSRSKRQQHARALRWCNTNVFQGGSFGSASHEHNVRPTTKLRSASVRTASTTSMPVPGGRDFFAWLVDLPWNRVGVWVVVAWFMYQLKDFFGVCSCRLAPTASHSRDPAPAVAHKPPKLYLTRYTSMP